MDTSPTPALAGVNLKLARASEHLRSIAAIDEHFATVTCEIVFTEDHDKNLGYLVIHLPEPPLELSAIVGDCLQNLRSALDYMVWQIVLSNPPNQPDKRTMFPICTSPRSFAEQRKRGRLSGVPDQAVALIEQAQPFQSAYHPLALLEQLCNADKHRDLHLTISVASDIDIYYSRNGEVYLRTILGNDEVRNGAILGNIGIPLDKALFRPDVQVHGDTSAFVAFRDLNNSMDDSLGVTATLREIRGYVADETLSPLARFVRDR